MFLYSAVSSHLDSSKRFTLSSPGRPVHSNTNSASLGSILEMGGTILSKTVKEKDLGVTMNANMKVS